MIACGGGKNGSGRQANLAVASSHSDRNTPSAISQGLRWRIAVPARPRREATMLATSTSVATTKAAMARSVVRDQSPTSSRTRQDAPNAAQASAAVMPDAASRSLSVSPVLRVSSPVATSDRENVDIDALCKFVGIGARLEDGDDLQVVGISLQFLLECRAMRMVMVGVIAHHAFEVGERRLLRRVRLERFRRVARVLR